MKYSFKSERPEYTHINYESKIDFNNDTIFFNSIIDMYRHLYYASSNNFILEVSNGVFKHRKLLKTLIRHNADIKCVLNDVTILNIFNYCLIVLLNLYYKVNFSKVQFKPTLKTGLIANTKIYILDGYVINDDSFKYRGNYTNATDDLSSLNFEYTLGSENVCVNLYQDQKFIDKEFRKFDYEICGDSVIKCNRIPKVFIYDSNILDNKITLSIFFQGYQNYNQHFDIKMKPSFNLVQSDDWKYYSKKSKCFKDNFYKLEVDALDFDLSFMYCDQFAKIILTRHLATGCINNEIAVINDTTSLQVTTQVDDYKDNYYRLIEDKQKQISAEIYLFQDREYSADDNAEALYRYYQKFSQKDIYFVLNRNSKDWNRLKADGFNLLSFGSLEHCEKYLLSTKVISSHAARRVYDPFYPLHTYRNLEKFKFIFLQHGIIMGEHHGFLDKINNDIDLFIASTEEEVKLIKAFSGFKNVALTGMARYDNYSSITVEDNYLLYAPSWNVIYKDNLVESEYVKEIQKVLNSKPIYESLKRCGLTIKVALHPEFINQNLRLENRYNYQVLKQNEFLYSDILKGCIALLTDYSSIFFDVLYQGKAVIHHRPYSLHHENNKLFGYQDAIHHSIEINELEKIIEQLSRQGFKINKYQSELIQKFFKYNDNEFCQRNFKEIELLI